jgi:hypothetical protein
MRRQIGPAIASCSLQLTLGIVAAENGKQLLINLSYFLEATVKHLRCPC